MNDTDMETAVQRTKTSIVQEVKHLEKCISVVSNEVQQMEHNGPDKYTRELQDAFDELQDLRRERNELVQVLQEN